MREQLRHCWAIMRAVACAAVGIASRRQLSHDAANLNPIVIIVSAVIATVAFVVLLLCVIAVIT